MPIIRDKPAPPRFSGAGDFLTWWLPELGATAALVVTGVTAWWPFGVAAVLPAFWPARSALEQVAYAQLERQVRYLEAAQADAERGEPGPFSVLAHAERLDRPTEIEGGGGEQR